MRAMGLVTLAPKNWGGRSKANPRVIRPKAIWLVVSNQNHSPFRHSTRSKHKNQQIFDETPSIKFGCLFVCLFVCLF